MSVRLLLDRSVKCCFIVRSWPVVRGVENKPIVKDYGHVPLSAITDYIVGTLHTRFNAPDFKLPIYDFTQRLVRS